MEGHYRRAEEEDASLAWTGTRDNRPTETDAVIWAAYMSMVMNRRDDKSAGPFSITVDTGHQTTEGHPETIIKN